MRRLPDYVRRRWVRVCAFSAMASVTLTLIYKLLILDGGDPDDEQVALVALFVTLAALGAALGRLLPPLPAPSPEQSAEDLAVTIQTQWEEEVTARQLRHPRVIPLAWSSTRRPVAAEPDVGSVARVVRLSLDGRLDGTFDVAARQLADRYRQVPGGRLVLLGEPGAGKTMLAAMLTLGLLAGRAPHEPVPVLLSISSWDPISQPLDDWIVGELSTAYFGGQSQIPRLLIRRRPQNRPLLLPVLDGLDELPDNARRYAVHAIDEACDDGRGVVLTCRSVEYEDVIEGGSPTLRRAPVVEVAPVPLREAIAYLEAISWPPGVDWKPVYARLRSRPDGPSAKALSTPLMLSVARTVYRNCDRDPSELLALESRHAVEDHLIDHVITAAYAPLPGSTEQHAADEWRAEAEQARKWLTFLAAYLHRHRERDLAWWRMSRRLMSRWAGATVGITVGLSAMLTAAVIIRCLDAGQKWQAPSAYVGGTFAVLTTIAWYAAPDRAPSKLSPTVRGSVPRLRRGFLTGIKPVTVLVVPILCTAAVIVTVTEGWSAGRLLSNLTGFGAVMGLITAVGAAMAVHEWLAAPPKRSTGADPLRLLRQDRTSSLVGAAAAGIVLGVVMVPLVVLGFTVSHQVNLSLTTTSTNPSFWDIAEWVTTGQGSGPYDTPLLTVAYTVLPAAVCATITLLTRAWPKFAVLHLVLAAQGRLPWRLAGFLDDARGRQLLRQSAGTYQFRHVRLQERLASTLPARNRALPRRSRSVRRRRVQTASVACSLLLLGSLGMAHVLPRNSSQAALLTGPVQAMAFTPDGLALVTVHGATVRRWDVRTGKELRGSRLTIDCSHPDGLVAEALAIRSDGTFHLLDATSRLHTLRADGEPRRPSISFPTDAVLDAGGTHVTADDGRIRYDTLRNRRSRSHAPATGHHVRPVALAANGSLLAYEGDHSAVTVRDLLDGTRRSAPITDRTSDYPDPIMSADGTRLVNWYTHIAQLRKADGEKHGAPINDTRNIDTLTLNHDGSMLATHSGGFVRLWDVR